MKKLSVVLMFGLVMGLMAGPAFAQSYCQDVLETGNPGGRTTGLKTCDTVNPETLNPGDTFSIDIWATEIPEPIISSGFEMFYNPAQVSLLSVQAYDGVDIAGGPWDGTATLKIPDAYGPGSFVLAVVQLGTCPVPDAGGDVIVAKLTFQCLANGSSGIGVKGIDGFDTTVGCTSGVVYDAPMGTNTLTVTQGSDGCTTNEECSDGIYCNGAETCNIGSGECQPGTAVVCNDAIACTTDSCNETTDSCDYIPNNAACNDGAYCNGAEVCTASGCAPGTPVSCPDDGLFCNGTPSCNETTDSCQSSGAPCTPPEVCNEDTDTCAVVGCSTDEECSDGSFCSGVETCNTNTGQCQAGTAVNCNDSIDCTIDSCNEGLDRCDNTPSDAACSDGLFCNGNEVCDAQNGCLDGTPADCADDGAFCNGTESCDEAADSCVSSGNPCTPGTVCNEETNGCDQPPGCEVDEECDNGLFCDGAERCVDGTCQPGTAVNCDDEVACTTDSCNEATDSCDHASDNAVCSDGNFCNGNEICDAVNGCLPGEAVSCADDGLFCNGTESCNEAADSCQSSGDPCPQGTVCNEATDACDEIPVEGCTSNAECDDGNFCNGKEKCSVSYKQSGGTPQPPVPGVCVAGTPVDCNDGVDCTIDSCNEAKDACDHAPDNAVCDDGNFCNGNEVCAPDSIMSIATQESSGSMSGCKAGAAVICQDNGLFCDGIESCNEAKDSCTSSGNPCTPDVTVCNEKTDTCDPVGGCTSDKECDDGIFCNGKETCNAYVKATGTNPPVTGVCQDGIPVDCSDGLDCTIDSCNEEKDACDHAPDNAVCDDGDFCNGNEICDPLKGCQDGAAVSCPDNGLFCDGTESCNEADDSCQSSGNPCTPGVTVCNEKTDTCDPVGGCTADKECDDGIFCNGKETCNAYAKATGTNPPVTGVCQSGIPVDCNDGVDCTMDSCNEDTDSCVNTADDAYCPDDGKFCNGTESCDAEQGCISTGNPCAAGTVCNEEKDSCEVKEITVKMDIKPGSCPNPLNLKSKGVLPVAILGSKDFNVKDIDPATIMLSREGIPGGVAPIRYNYADVATPFEGELCDCNRLYGDGYKDLTLKFKKTEVISELLLAEVAGETVPLTITFSLKQDKGGADYSAEDCLKILKKKEKKIKFRRDKK